ncbi:MAG: DNA recombination protein RmuC [Muribaculaceae bacterium]|nr:DNA recombination protein RmuC [Muribaculaceae bacterium]
MDILLPIICFITGLLLGILIWSFVSRRADKSALYDEQIRILKEEMQKQSERQQDELQKEGQRHRQEMERHQQELMQQAQRHREEMQEQARRQEEALQQREDALRRESIAQFKALGAELLKQQTGELKQVNSEQINALLKPLEENIEGFRKAVTDSYVSENASRRSLTDQIKQLMELNKTIGMDAKNLTSALKGNTKVQGDWGEMILETMLEKAGLQKDIHFVTQATHREDGTLLRNDNGQLQRPDVIVFMPDARKVIIDSKVSLNAYTEYISAESDAEREAAASRNLLSVRRHIDELAGKNYQKSVDDSADHVLMFIPNEGAYLAAIQSDNDLWQYAWNRNVVMVSPTHLFSVLKIISQIWVQDKQNRNTLKIAEKGGDLYDKVVLFVEAMREVGTNLNKAMESYQTATNRLHTGRGNIIRLTEQLKELGAKAHKSLPRQLIEQSDTTPEDE